MISCIQSHQCLSRGMLVPNSFEAGYTFPDFSLTFCNSEAVFSSPLEFEILYQFHQFFLVKQMLTFLNCQMAHFSLDVIDSLHSDTSPLSSSIRPFISKASTLHFALSTSTPSWRFTLPVG